MHRAHAGAARSNTITPRTRHTHITVAAAARRDTAPLPIKHLSKICSIMRCDHKTIRPSALAFAVLWGCHRPFANREYLPPLSALAACLFWFADPPSRLPPRRASAASPPARWPRAADLRRDRLCEKHAHAQQTTPHNHNAHTATVRSATRTGA